MSFLCIACGKDLTYLYKDWRSFSEDSKGAAEPCKQALSSWIEVMEKELIIYQKSFSAIFPHPSEAGKVCRKCFDGMGKYFRLKEELLQRVHVATEKMGLISQPRKIL